eukprot:scaffold591_cov121-Isochrysis_galbana.AAC.7
MPFAFWPRKPSNPSCLWMSSKKAHGTGRWAPQPKVWGTRSARVDDCCSRSSRDPCVNPSSPPAGLNSSPASRSSALRSDRRLTPSRASVLCRIVRAGSAFPAARTRSSSTAVGFQGGVSSSSRSSEAGGAAGVNAVDVGVDNAGRLRRQLRRPQLRHKHLWPVGLLGRLEPGRVHGQARDQYRIADGVAKGAEEVDQEGEARLAARVDERPHRHVVVVHVRAARSQPRRSSSNLAACARLTIPLFSTHRSRADGTGPRTSAEKAAAAAAEAILVCPRWTDGFGGAGSATKRGRCLFLGYDDAIFRTYGLRSPRGGALGGLLLPSERGALSSRKGLGACAEGRRPPRRAVPQLNPEPQQTNIGGQETRDREST